MPRHMLFTISPNGSYSVLSVSLCSNLITGRLLIAARVGLGAGVMQDVVIEVTTNEDVGNFGVD